MDSKRSLLAVAELESSPASRWIGNRLTDDGRRRSWLQKCMRCGAEVTLSIPRSFDSPEAADAFDERLFRWKRSFQIDHEGCVDGDLASRSAPASAPRSAPAPDPEVLGVTMKRVLTCVTHGVRTWQGHVMCDSCGQTYQAASARGPGDAPDVCGCGSALLPPPAERVGDALGFGVGGLALDGRGRSFVTHHSPDWSARPICYLCFRHFKRRCGGRVPVDRDRN